MMVRRRVAVASLSVAMAGAAAQSAAAEEVIITRDVACTYEVAGSATYPLPRWQFFRLSGYAKCEESSVRSGSEGQDPHTRGPDVHDRVPVDVYGGVATIVAAKGRCLNLHWGGLIRLELPDPIDAYFWAETSGDATGVGVSDLDGKRRNRGYHILEIPPSPIKYSFVEQADTVGLQTPALCNGIDDRVRTVRLVLEGTISGVEL